ncbi:hypothetical protein F5Y13DRAFT_192027 [Hypoxylon sp. FL1857]|nr:hypothetical protein F5Y13DRAFT_192027 [Hypoxylon sp. FL1857]
MTSLNRVQSNMAEAPFPLLELPTEIVLKICEVLLPKAIKPYKTFREHKEAQEHFSDMANLARSCKGLRNAATELLRKHRMHNPMEEGILGYAHRIIQNWHLARRETIFKMSPFDNTGSLDEDDLLTLDEIADDLEFEVKPSDYKDDLVQEGRPEMGTPLFHHARARIAYLIVSRLPNLTSLTLYSTAAHRFDVEENFVSRISLPALKHAKFVGFRSRHFWDWNEVQFNHTHEDFELSPTVDCFSFVEYIRAAPNLEELEFEHMDTCTRYLCLTGVRSLRFNNCRFRTRHLFRSLGQVPELKSFTYRTGFYNNYLQQDDYDDYYEPEHTVTPSDVWQTLKLCDGVACRLHTLEIDIRETGPMSRRDSTYVRHREQVFLKDLSRFYRLRTLSLTQQTLWEKWFDRSHNRKKIQTVRGKSRLIETLPRGIKSFSLSDITIEFFPCLLCFAAYLRSRKRSFRRLKEVHLRPSPDLVRQLKHAKAHQDGEFPDYFDASCGEVEHILDKRAKILEDFKEAGVKADFPFDSYPLFTDNKEDLQRQQDMQHWCHRCHTNDMGCLERKKNELSGESGLGWDSDGSPS